MKIKRPIIEIDQSKCDGCGLCASACAEGAIEVVDGKARLVRELFCDGMGACLGHCPTGALTIVERDSDPFDESAVQEHLADREVSRREAVRNAAPAAHPVAHFGGCPGAALREFAAAKPVPTAVPSEASALGHWPVQLMLVPPHAPFLRDADLLVCADCVPFALPDFHRRFLAGRALVVGCPKLDDLAHYEQKFAAIFAVAKPRAVTVLRMEVPCCGGIVQAVARARAAADAATPIDVHTISIDGRVLRSETI